MPVLLRMPEMMSDWERATLQMRTCNELQVQLHKAAKTIAEHCSQPPRAAAMGGAQRSHQPRPEQSNKKHDNRGQLPQFCNPHLIHHPIVSLLSVHTASIAVLHAPNLPEPNRKQTRRQLYISRSGRLRH